MAFQEGVATFTGTEPYIDLTWSTHYASFRLYTGLETTDGTIPGIRLVNPSNGALPPDNTAVRVEPTAPFSGKVYVVNLEIV